LEIVRDWPDLTTTMFVILLQEPPASLAPATSNGIGGGSMVVRSAACRGR
jgi:hypothetical protein